jgi:AraC family transcriptional regulator
MTSREPVARPPITAAEWAGLMPRPAIACSAGINWRTISAFRFIHPECDSVDTPPLQTHLIVCHLANPSGVSQRLNGRRRAGLSRPGDIMIMAANQPSEWTWERSPDVLHLYLDTALVRQAALEAGGDGFDLADGVCIPDPAICRIGLDLLAELQQPGFGSNLYGEALSQALAVQLLRRHSTLGRAPAAGRDGLPAYKLRRALEYIDDNLSSDLSVEEIARAAATSPFHFSRAFKLSTGDPPHRFVLRRRVERAQDLLRSSDLPLVEVALAVGFASQAHFSTVFRRCSGMSPKKYRDTLRG